MLGKYAQAMIFKYAELVGGLANDILGTCIIAAT